MKKALHLLLRLGIGLLVLLLLLSIIVYWRYGGGGPYPDLSTKAILPQSSLETFFSYPEPIGNVAATRDSNTTARVFFTVHPESRPENHKVLEIVEGKAIPFPSEEAQKELYETVLGLYVDQQNRLWTIDHGNHGFGKAKLLAFDLHTNTLIHEYHFPLEIAERGSFFNDLCVSPDGRYVFIADVSFWRKRPSLVVYDTQEKIAKSLLDGHPSIQAENYLIETPSKKMRFFGGLANLKPSIDGIDISWDGTYVYYAPMTNAHLFRIPTSALTNWSLDKATVEAKVEEISSKPMSDGIRLDSLGNVYITDVEHQGIAIVRPNGSLQTLLKHPSIRWADGLSFAGDGYCYLADSAIPEQMLQSKAHIKSQQPYFIFRFKPPYDQLAQQ